MRLDSDVLAVLAAAETEGGTLRLTGQLDRALYVKVGKAIETAGGKWNRKAGAHLFDGDATAIVAGMLAAGTVVSEKAVQQFYPTPPAVVARLLALAALEPYYTVLEPSAGRGAIAERVAPLVAAVDCVELYEQHAAVIRAAGYARTLTVGDFLAAEPAPVYDRVIMNPPFTRGADTAHAAHALRFVRPGGRLVSVMSGSVTGRSDRAAVAFRQTVTDSGGGFEPLPDGSFAESGTGVSAVVAVVPKPAANILNDEKAA